jgi:hypothetical protein
MKRHGTDRSVRNVVSPLVLLLLLAPLFAVRGADTTPSESEEAIAAFDKAVAAAKENLLKSLAPGASVAAVDPTATPPAFRFADAGANAAVGDFAKAIASAKDDLIKKLEGRLAELTKAGNLDEALKVRDAISKLKAKPVPAQTAPAVPKTGATIMPQKDVAGTWVEGNGTVFVFGADGSFMYANMYRGNWVLNETGLILTFKTGWPGQVRIYNSLNNDGMLTGHYSDNTSKVLSMKKGDSK